MQQEPETGNADEHLVGYKTVIAKVNWGVVYGDSFCFFIRQLLLVLPLKIARYYYSLKR